jgi:hypothetical protein
MGDVRPKSGNDLSQPLPSLSGIDGMGCEFRPRYPSRGRAFEIDVRQEILVVWRGLATRIRHGKQRDFVALTSHQVHELEHVNLSATEGKIVFIAVENSHMQGAP